VKLDLSIDENNLMEEWRGQAALMLDYGIQLADAMQEEDEAKAELSVTIAELDKSVREDPAAYGIAKVTEAGVKAAIDKTKEVAKATSMVNEAKHETRVLKAVIDALQHRKSSLQGMTDLFMKQWYADPSNSEQPALKEAGQSAKAQTPPTKSIKGRVVRRAKN
jgi:hypothetical protein